MRSKNAGHSDALGLQRCPCDTDIKNTPDAEAYSLRARRFAMLSIYFITPPENCLYVGGVFWVRLQFLSQAPDDILHRSGPIAVLLIPGGAIKLFLAEYQPRSAGQEHEHGELAVVQVYLFPCLEHHPPIWVDLYVPKCEYLMSRRCQFNNFCAPVSNRVHDSPEHTTVRICGPNDDNFFDPQRPPSFLLLIHNLAAAA